ncbi:hypothetical protein RclHR1_15400004 [Rhizophagus clarus]|uniref:Uncharacterized protein n=1 Tax=Rhizophagus clarus TaxID=94130 RepID=A0A2Z6QVT6_9GLOM|nr:hypothetical protein RclHR1_15400004 [Rhizophagus clarus]GES80296.1 hypothetical protein RCL_jg7388.t1 [Rhizophagus clarus]
MLRELNSSNAHEWKTSDVMNLEDAKVISDHTPQSHVTLLNENKINTKEELTALNDELARLITHVANV